jgi:protease-4
VQRDGFWRSLGRTAAKCVVALATLGIGSIVLLALLAGGLAAIAGVVGSDAEQADELNSDFVEGDLGNGNVLLAVPVTGTILGESGGGGLFGGVDATYGYQIRQKLSEAAERRDIDGVVLEMDTPGGTIFGSRAIADAVSEYRQRTGNPVVAYVRGLSASGGMLAMSGADRIVADHGTLIGSIGVIFGPLTYYDGVVAVDGGLLGGGVETRGGISVEYLTAGRGKDVGNPFRRLTEEERAVLQQGVDRAYQGFVDTVAEGRELPRERIITELGALIFDEQTARDKGLVDEVGNRDRAYRAAAELAGLAPGNYQVRRLDLGGGGLLSALAGEAGGGDGNGGTGDGGAGPSGSSGSAVAAAGKACINGPQLLALMGAAPPLCGS